MEREFFVMLNHPRGCPAIMTHDGEEVAWYETEEGARKDAEFSPLGSMYGFEIFRRGDGLYQG